MGSILEISRGILLPEHLHLLTTVLITSPANQSIRDKAAIVNLITVALMTEISLDLESLSFNTGIIVSIVLAIVAVAVAIMQKKRLKS